MLAPANELDLDAIARQHLDMIFASALRQLPGDTAAAADVTQSVLLILLQKSRDNALPKETHMAGWLLSVTRFAVKQFKRTAARRAKHESAAAASQSSSDSAPMESDIRAALDSAVLSLPSIDREAVARRFLQGQSLAEVASALSMTENTAGRRVSPPALEKLRKILSRRRIAAPALTLTAVLTAESAIKAPAACAGGIAASTIPTELAKTVLSKMALAKSAATLATILSLLAALSTAAAFAIKLQTASPAPAVSLAAPATVPGPITISVTTEIKPPQTLSSNPSSPRSKKTARNSTPSTSSPPTPPGPGTPNPTDFSAPTKPPAAWAESAAPRRLRTEVQPQRVARARRRQIRPRLRPPAPKKFRQHLGRPFLPPTLRPAPFSSLCQRLHLHRLRFRFHRLDRLHGPSSAPTSPCNSPGNAKPPPTPPATTSISTPPSSTRPYSPRKNSPPEKSS